MSNCIVNKNLSRPNEQNGSWKGDFASYAAIHMWISRHFGKATICEYCGKIGSGKFVQWANISGKYRRERSDWLNLCASCHKKRDYEKKYGNACMKGHEFTKENTYIAQYKNKGWKRYCRICGRTKQMKWKKAKRSLLNA